MRWLAGWLAHKDAFAASGTPPEAVRVCLAGAATRQDCCHALELIADALHQLPAVAATVM